VSPPWPTTLTKLPEGALSPRLASARGSPTRKIAGQGAAKPSPAGPGCGFMTTPREESGPTAPPIVEIEYFFRVRFSTKAENRRFPKNIPRGIKIIPQSIPQSPTSKTEARPGTRSCRVLRRHPIYQGGLGKRGPGRLSGKYPPTSRGSLANGGPARLGK
jgi:hypothetical protein